MTNAMLVQDNFMVNGGKNSRFQTRYVLELYWNGMMTVILCSWWLIAKYFHIIRYIVHDLRFRLHVISTHMANHTQPSLVSILELMKQEGDENTSLTLNPCQITGCQSRHSFAIFSSSFEKNLCLICYWEFLSLYYEWWRKESRRKHFFP